MMISQVVRSAYLLPLALACCSIATITARAEEPDNHQHAHVHGIASLGVAVDRDIVTIQLETPLDSVIGFEHRANTPAERATVESLQARMKAPRDLFTMTPAAGCRLRKADADSAIFKAPGAAPSDEHADLDAAFEYRCAHIERLKSIDVGLFDAYPGLQQLQVSVVTDKGQFKNDLKRPARTIALVR